MTHAMTAIIVATVGAIVSATANAADGGDLTGYAQGAGVATVVGALVWAFRLMVKGELVARSVNDMERQLKDLIVVSQRLVDAAHDREDTLHALLNGGPTRKVGR